MKPVNDARQTSQIAPPSSTVTYSELTHYSLLQQRKLEQAKHFVKTIQLSSSYQVQLAYRRIVARQILSSANLTFNSFADSINADSCLALVQSIPSDNNKLLASILDSNFAIPSTCPMPSLSFPSYFDHLQTIASLSYACVRLGTAYMNPDVVQKSISIMNTVSSWARLCNTVIADQITQMAKMADVWNSSFVAARSNAVTTSYNNIAAKMADVLALSKTAVQPVMDLPFPPEDMNAAWSLCQLQLLGRCSDALVTLQNVPPRDGRPMVELQWASARTNEILKQQNQSVAKDPRDLYLILNQTVYAGDTADYIVQDTLSYLANGSTVSASQDAFNNFIRNGSPSGSPSNFIPIPSASDKNNNSIVNYSLLNWLIPSIIALVCIIIVAALIRYYCIQSKKSTFNKYDKRADHKLRDTVASYAATVGDFDDDNFENESGGTWHDSDVPIITNIPIHRSSNSTFSDQSHSDLRMPTTAEFSMKEKVNLDRSMDHSFSRSIASIRSEEQISSTFQTDDNSMEQKSTEQHVETITNKELNMSPPIPPPKRKPRQQSIYPKDISDEDDAMVSHIDLDSPHPVKSSKGWKPSFKRSKERVRKGESSDTIDNITDMYSTANMSTPPHSPSPLYEAFMKDEDIPSIDQAMSSSMLPSPTRHETIARPKVNRQVSETDQENQRIRSYALLL